MMFDNGWNGLIWIVLALALLGIFRFVLRDCIGSLGFTYGI